ncbi:helix-turn-helix domain-containing protein [Paenibacillus sp. Aloe-11]|uniref:helix-turn-helix domain-containing protein n=1 Tax=Paenibacillus sp. Aloe-11 TaxID=1050222 RepID=UPI00024EF5B4|nr:helix-turn-helix transcriptional regulator [Paenibacillus sp. Aloe-11]EHS58318.1 hypothetical protein WG8_1578 [Paenibacillus sp. Aloe-11]
MNTIHLSSMNKEELVELYNDASRLIFADSKESKEQFVRDSSAEWKEVGQEYKQRRQLLNISLRKLSGLLGCSESKLRKWENGQPVQAADMLQHSYDMALQLEAIKQEAEKLKVKDISNEATLSENEIREFYTILWTWISSSDYTYHLYEFIQNETNENDPNALYKESRSASEFSCLLDDYLDEESSLEFYKEYHQKVKQSIQNLN